MSYNHDIFLREQDKAWEKWVELHVRGKKVPDVILNTMKMCFEAGCVFTVDYIHALSENK